MASKLGKQGTPWPNQAGQAAAAAPAVASAAPALAAASAAAVAAPGGESLLALEGVGPSLSPRRRCHRALAALVRGAKSSTAHDTGKGVMSRLFYLRSPSSFSSRLCR